MPASEQTLEVARELFLPLELESGDEAVAAVETEGLLAARQSLLTDAETLVALPSKRRFDISL
jgi:hypothetical protein